MTSQNTQQKDAKKPSLFGWYLLAGMSVVYGIVAFYNMKTLVTSGSFLWSLVIQLIPIFIFVYILMVLTDRYVSTAVIDKYMGKEAGVRAWVVMTIGGIISTGPIYAWYPFLSDLQKKGVSDGLLTTFLYNRSIKIQFIPLLISYFTVSYVLVLTILMIIFSTVQGFLMNIIMNHKQITNNFNN